jgi:threonine dehydratase
MEILEDLPNVDTVVVTNGGGGLISGIATAVAGTDPDVRVVGVQAEGASSVAPALEKGERVELDAVDTIADGIATRSVGESTFEVIRERVDEVVTVADDEVAVALTQLLERGKTLVEGAGAVPLAALLEGAFDYEEEETVVPVLSGGNIDLNMLRTVVVRGLAATGRYLRLRTVLNDRPGALQDLVAIIAREGANIYAIQHDRTSGDVAIDDTEVEVDLETRGPEHVDSLVAALDDAGYDIDVLV